MYRKCDRVCPVAVGSDVFKAVTHAFALGLIRRVPTEGSCNGFFIAPPTSAVLHTIARVQPDCVEEKGYTVSVKARGNYPQQSVVLV